MTMTTTTRTINFRSRDGHAITLERNDGGLPVLLDYVFTCRRLNHNWQIKQAACESRISANRVATLCRIIDPLSEYRAVEHSGWGWVIKKRDHFTNTVSTVTNIGVLRQPHRPGVYMRASELAELTGYSSTATFTY